MSIYFDCWLLLRMIFSQSFYGFGGVQLEIREKKKKKKKKKIAWLNLEKVCQPKVLGGLDFHDLELFNQSLVAKQGERLLQDDSSLASRVLKGKYFYDKYLDAEYKSGSSYLWNSFFFFLGGSLLKKWLHYWRVCSREKIKPFIDPWLPRPYSFKVVSPSSHSLSFVKDLIHINGEWKHALIDTCFSPCWWWYHKGYPFRDGWSRG